MYCEIIISFFLNFRYEMFLTHTKIHLYIISKKSVSFSINIKCLSWRKKLWNGKSTLYDWFFSEKRKTFENIKKWCKALYLNSRCMCIGFGLVYFFYFSNPILPSNISIIIMNYSKCFSCARDELITVIPKRFLSSKHAFR